LIELDYYEVLQISKTADNETIKKSYRKLAMEFHPDRNPGNKDAEEKFKLINEAYQVLSDEQKRSIYDRYGKKGLDGGASGFGGFDFGDLGSIFDNFFGGGNGKKQSDDKYNLDVGVEITISFLEAVFGCKKDVEFAYKNPCGTCRGTGAKDGKRQTCPDCGGQGQVYMRQGFMTFSQTCPRCKGEGAITQEKCPECKGKGYEDIKEKITVDIPAGVDNGNRIRVNSKGNIGAKGARGDLYVILHVQEDAKFVRDGDDVYIEAPIFFTQTLLSENVTIPSLRDQVELKLSPNVTDKQHFIFKNEGIDNLRTKRRGSFVVQVKLIYPKSLTNEQAELVAKLQASFGHEVKKQHDHELKDVWTRVKDWFSLGDKE
jgi:molecular chaperone DnaJ